MLHTHSHTDTHNHTLNQLTVLRMKCFSLLRASVCYNWICSFSRVQ